MKREASQEVMKSRQLTLPAGETGWGGVEGAPGRLLRGSPGGGANNGGRKNGGCPAEGIVKTYRTDFPTLREEGGMT